MTTTEQLTTDFQSPSLTQEYIDAQIALLEQQWARPDVAIVGVDLENCFYLKVEGLRLGSPSLDDQRCENGMGELGCENGERTVQPMNRLMQAGRKIGAFLASTRDWHDPKTAHFAVNLGQEPDYENTWPVHAVANTPGAENHPEFDREGVVDYKKGQRVVENPADDDSYTAANGVDVQGKTLEEQIVENKTKTVILGGLALNKCVHESAVSFLALGLEVVIASDATEPVFEAQREEATLTLAKLGVKFLTTDEVIEQYLTEPVAA